MELFYQPVWNWNCFINQSGTGIVLLTSLEMELFDQPVWKCNDLLNQSGNGVV